MTDYLRRPGIQILQPPYVAEKTTFFAFAVRTDPAVVQAQLIDPILNRPLEPAAGGAPPARFELKTRFVLAVFNHIAHFGPAQPPDSDLGWHTEEEFAIWMLVEDTVTGDTFWFHPYMLVDNFYALAIGREVYGFPKEIGRFDITKEPERKPLIASALATPVFAPTSQSAWLPVATAVPPFSKESRPGAGVAHAGETVTKERDVYLTAVAAAAGPPDGESISAAELKAWDYKTELVLLAAALLDLDSPFLFLKQFPRIDDPRKVAYQAITEAALEVTKVRAMRVMLPWRLKLADFDSHPMLRTLGRAGDDTILPWLSSWLLLDFHVPAGTMRHKISL